jgi:phage terminase small subunit
MATRHEMDAATPRITVYDAAEVYELTHVEIAQMRGMDKDDQELADYTGFPMVQAQILLDRRETGYSEEIYSNVTGMGVTSEEMAPTAGTNTERALKTGASVIDITRGVKSIDQAAVA